MTQQLIIFDLDDTLVHCNIYFDQTLDAFTKMMIQNFGEREMSPENIRKKQQEIDLIGVEKLGFTLDHFPQSLVDTYLFLCELYIYEVDEKMVNEIRTLGEHVYKMNIEPYPFMVDTLNTLRNQGYSLYLYTGGVAEVQHRKIKQLGLDYFFGNHIHVARHKTIEEMDRLLTRLRADRKNTWMVGNSLRTDIVPALEAGIHAIYIPVHNEWKYNIVEVNTQPKGAYLTIESLLQLPEAISAYICER